MPRSSLALGLLAFLPAAGLAQSVPSESTTVLGPLAGRLATPAPGQWLDGSRFAADLGLTAIHEQQLRIVFGDAIAISSGLPIGLTRDDVQGEISLQAFPDGQAVDAYAAAAAGQAAGAPSWQVQAPPVTYRLNWLDQASTLVVYEGGAGGRLLNTGLFKAPVAVFSNAMAGADSGFFAIYARWVPSRCRLGAAARCDPGFECEPRLGQLGEESRQDATPCVLGSEDCFEVAGGGLCIDPTSSLYDAASPQGLARAVVWEHVVGNADPLRLERYYTRPWLTNKFTNLSARTVNDFDEARAEGRGNDYRPADGSSPEASKLFVWGRPGYIGTGASGHDLALYFAVVDLPRYSASADFAWAPRYFTGLSASGEPQFSADQREARALDLGAQPVAEREIVDVVNQMSVSWVQALGSWVMLYGGGTNEALAHALTQGQGALVQHDPEGAIHARFAHQPWGPWSAPQTLLRAGSPHPLTELPDASSQYGPGGFLRHPMCTSRECAPSEPSEDAEDYGFLYGANVIDAWTEPTGRGAVLYWNVSTWHPYQVLLIRSAVFGAVAGSAAPDGQEAASDAPVGFTSERAQGSGAGCRVAAPGSGRAAWASAIALLLLLRTRRHHLRTCARRRNPMALSP